MLIDQHTCTHTDLCSSRPLLGVPQEQVLHQLQSLLTSTPNQVLEVVADHGGKLEVLAHSQSQAFCPHILHKADTRSGSGMKLKKQVTGH